MFHRNNHLFLVIVVGAFALTLAEVDLLKILREGNNQFSGKMLPNVVELQPNKSIAISGFSLLTPLSLLELASSGSTRQELLNAIGLHDNTYIIKIFSKIVNHLKVTKGIHLKMINKLLVNMNYHVNELFDVIAREFFDTKVLNIDFAEAEQAAKDINNYIYKKTNHQIKKVIDPSFMDGNTGAVLVNILYFKGKWKHPFRKEMTKKETFYINNQNTVEVLMMHNTARYKYAESRKLDAKILEITYAGHEASMVIVLPNQIEGKKSLLGKLENLSVLDEEMRHMELSDVKVAIPKFKLETTIDLKDVLKKMNITKIFTNKAELNGLIKSCESLHLSKAIQKVFMEVDETDTKEVSINDLQVTLLSKKPMTGNKTFVANHPFLSFVKIHGITLFSLSHDDMIIIKSNELTLSEVLS